MVDVTIEAINNSDGVIRDIVFDSLLATNKHRGRKPCFGEIDIVIR
jgi:hypothetical protein